MGTTSPTIVSSIIGFVFSPELNAPPILLYLNLSFVVDVFCRSSSLAPLMILVTVLVNPQGGIPIRKAVITLRSRLLSFIRITWSEYFLNCDYFLFQFHVIMPFIFILFASFHTLNFQFGHNILLKIKLFLWPYVSMTWFEICKVKQ